MEAQGPLSMPGLGFFDMPIIGIVAGWIADKATASDHGLRRDRDALDLAAVPHHCVRETLFCQ
jgi:hypothetical protein